MTDDPRQNHLRLHKTRASGFDHPVNIIHITEATFGERLADQIAGGIGSWRFLIIQTFLVVLWLVLNLVGLVSHWDPFPFILLNLLFSVQAAYTGPVLLLAGNRQSQKDRLTLEHTADEAEKAEHTTVQILKEIENNTALTLRILQQMESSQQQLLQGQQQTKTSQAGGQPPPA